MIRKHKRIRVVVTVLNVLLAVVSIFALTSCKKNKSSGLSLSMLELKLSSGEWHFTTQETENGYSFQYDQEGVSWVSCEKHYFGETDKNHNITKVTLQSGGIDTTKLSSFSAVDKLLKKTVDELSWIDFEALSCASDLEVLLTLVDPLFDGLAKHPDTLYNNFSGSPISINGWTINSRIDSLYNTVTITATYNS